MSLTAILDRIYKAKCYFWTKNKFPYIDGVWWSLENKESFLTDLKVPIDLDQWFSTFFDSRHPYLVFQQFGGTPNYNLLVNKGQDQKLAAPLELFAAPRLRTTDLDDKK